MIGKRHEYDAMAHCEEQLWWYKCLHQITEREIQTHYNKQATILDAGCGTGGMLSHLQRTGYTNLKGFDLSADGVEYTKEKTGLPIHRVSILECSSFYKGEIFDIIICNDILVLLDDNDAQIALENLIDLLKPGGLLLMNLAAGKLFRGTHDVACELKRRYNKPLLKKMVAKTSATISKSIYWPFLMSPAIFALRSGQRLQLLLSKNRDFKSDVKLPSPFLNKLFLNITRFDIKIPIAKPWGSSLFTVIRKEV